MKLKSLLTEKKELEQSFIDDIARHTDRNNHTEARIKIAQKMGNQRMVKFYKAMMEINDVFRGYPPAASKLNQMMEKELYREMLRTWSNYDDIYNAL